MCYIMLYSILFTQAGKAHRQMHILYLILYYISRSFISHIILYISYYIISRYLILYYISRSTYYISRSFSFGYSATDRFDAMLPVVAGVAGYTQTLLAFSIAHPPTHIERGHNGDILVPDVRYCSTSEPAESCYRESAWTPPPLDHTRILTRARHKRRTCVCVFVCVCDVCINNMI